MPRPDDRPPETRELSAGGHRGRFAVTLRQPGERGLIHCRQCGYQGRVLKAHARFRWYFLPAGFLLGCTGVGLIPLVLLVLYLGQITWPICPACGAKRRLSLWKGVPTPEAEATWRRALEADRREFLRTKLSLIALVALVIGVILLYLLIQAWF